MKAIIVDGGPATRLGVEPPKCAVVVGEIPLINHTLRLFIEMGIADTTVIMGQPGVDRLEKIEAARYVKTLIDYKLNGTLAALGEFAWLFCDQDVIITTGDAFYESLNSLRGCAKNFVLALVDVPRRGVTQIRIGGSSVNYVGLKPAVGSLSYASAIRVNKCPSFWRGVKEALRSSRKRIVDALIADALMNVEFRAVNGFWRNINAPSDLEAVRDYVENS